jgi:ABC-type transporter Mla MlaB component
MAKAANLSKGMRAPERLTVEHAADAFDQMQHFVATHDAIHVDLSTVVSVDTAGLQLLTVIRREVVRHGKTIEFSGAPDCVIEAARLLGVEHQIGLV